MQMPELAWPNNEVKPPAPSVLRAFWAMVWFSFRRHWKIRQVGWVGLGLLALMAVVIGAITHGPVGWKLENRERPIANLKDKDGTNPIRMNYQQYGDERLTYYQAFPGPPASFAVKSAIFDVYRALLRDERFLKDFAFLQYSRWVVFSLFLGFLLPLFTLAYGTGAIGGERESRTLLWLYTRPLPRWGLYLAKLLGVLPWCVGICLFGFTVLCLVGGEYGRRAFGIYWPVVVAASLAFGSVFHMVGAVVRRPTVVGLIYVFFFETLVANLPGSLKQFSLSYYIKSLFYNGTAANISTVQPESVDVYAPADSPTAWLTLAIVCIAVTIFGAWRFSVQEPKEET
jgi:ABC-2 type transport system permease protein